MIKLNFLVIFKMQKIKIIIYRDLKNKQNLQAKQADDKSIINHKIMLEIIN